MANHDSAEKRTRQIAKRTVVNRNRLGRIKTFIKKVEVAITAGDKEQATVAYRVAQPEIMRGVTKGIFHLNTVSRKLSRLSARIKSLS